MKRIFVVLLSVAMLWACNKQANNEIKNIEIPQGTEKIVEANNEFGIQMLQLIYNTDTNSNYIFSPLSLNIALTMTYNGANGQTASQMKDVLKLNDFSVDEVNSLYKILLDELPTVDKKTDLEIANAVWFDQGLDVVANFKNNMKKYYSAEIQTQDLGQQETIDDINNWVKKQTHKKIDKILDEPSNDMAVVLLNAIYFKSEWQNKFDKSNTELRDFLLTNGEVVQVPTMFGEEISLKVDYDHNCSLYEIPYSNGNFVMDIFMADNGNIDSALNGLQYFDEMLSEATDANADLYLPKFKVENELKLKNVLVHLMPNAFNNADFSNMTSTSVSISKVIQRAIIETSEDGSEAAAVTVVVVNYEAAPGNVTTIRIDRPFIYFIREVTTGAIIFAGIIKNPA